MLTPNYQLKRQARDSLRGNWGNAILTYIVFLLLSLAVAFVPLGTILLGAPLTVGFALYFLTLAKNQPVSVGLIFKPFNFYGNALLAWFLRSIIILLAAIPAIIVLVIMLISMGTFDFDAGFTDGFKMFNLTILLIITLILPIWFSLRLALVYYLVSDYPQFPADAAISLSWKAMAGKEWKLVGLYLSYIGWYLLSIITIGIASLWWIPYMNTALANFYLDVKNADNLELIINERLHKEELPPAQS